MSATKLAPTARTVVEFSNDYDLVDKHTGEVMPMVVGNKAGAKRYGFVGGYILMGLLDITKLRQIKMSGTGKDLALLLVEKVGYTGLCETTFVDLASELGVHISQVSRMMAILERHRLIKRIGGSRSHVIMINPTFAFRGKPAEHHLALVKWAELHPLGLAPRASQPQPTA